MRSRDPANAPTPHRFPNSVLDCAMMAELELPVVVGFRCREAAEWLAARIGAPTGFTHIQPHRRAVAAHTAAMSPPLIPVHQAVTIADCRYRPAMSGSEKPDEKPQQPQGKKK
jgi:hypothetical protein